MSNTTCVLDKVLICGGAARSAFGGGEVLEPSLVFAVDRIIARRRQRATTSHARSARRIDKHQTHKHPAEALQDGVSTRMTDIFSWTWHHHVWLWIIPVSLLLVCAVALLMLLFRRPGWHQFGWNKEESDQVLKHILDRRYASGEITREQYEEMKKALRV